MNGFLAIFILQWNPVNTDTKGTRQNVRIKRVLRKKETETCFMDEKTMATIFYGNKL